MRLAGGPSLSSIDEVVFEALWACPQGKETLQSGAALVHNFVIS